MEKYHVILGFDYGNAEDGPRVSTFDTIVEAKSEEDAVNKFLKEVDEYESHNNYCGGYAEIATEEQIEKFNKEVKELELMDKDFEELFGKE